MGKRNREVTLKSLTELNAGSISGDTKKFKNSKPFRKLSEQANKIVEDYARLKTVKDLAENLRPFETLLNIFSTREEAFRREGDDDSANTQALLANELTKLGKEVIGATDQDEDGDTNYFIEQIGKIIKVSNGDKDISVLGINIDEPDSNVEPETKIDKALQSTQKDEPTERDTSTAEGVDKLHAVAKEHPKVNAVNTDGPIQTDKPNQNKVKAESSYKRRDVDFDKVQNVTDLIQAVLKAETIRVNGTGNPNDEVDVQSWKSYGVNGQSEGAANIIKDRLEQLKNEEPGKRQQRALEFISAFIDPKVRSAIERVLINQKILNPKEIEKPANPGPANRPENNTANAPVNKQKAEKTPITPNAEQATPRNNSTNREKAENIFKGADSFAVFIDRLDELGAIVKGQRGIKAIENGDILFGQMYANVIGAIQRFDSREFRSLPKDARILELNKFFGSNKSFISDILSKVIDKEHLRDDNAGEPRLATNIHIESVVNGIKEKEIEKEKNSIKIEDAHTLSELQEAVRIAYERGEIFKDVLGNKIELSDLLDRIESAIKRDLPIYANLIPEEMNLRSKVEELTNQYRDTEPEYDREGAMQIPGLIEFISQRKDAEEIIENGSRLKKYAEAFQIIDTLTRDYPAFFTEQMSAIGIDFNHKNFKENVRDFIAKAALDNPETVLAWKRDLETFNEEQQKLKLAETELAQYGGAEMFEFKLKRSEKDLRMADINLWNERKSGVFNSLKNLAIRSMAFIEGSSGIDSGLYTQEEINDLLAKWENRRIEHRAGRKLPGEENTNIGDLIEEDEKWFKNTGNNLMKLVRYRNLRDQLNAEQKEWDEAKEYLDDRFDTNYSGNFIMRAIKGFKRAGQRNKEGKIWNDIVPESQQIYERAKAEFDSMSKAQPSLDIKKTAEESVKVMRERIISETEIGLMMVNVAKKSLRNFFRDDLAKKDASVEESAQIVNQYKAMKANTESDPVLSKLGLFEGEVNEAEVNKVVDLSVKRSIAASVNKMLEQKSGASQLMKQVGELVALLKREGQKVGSLEGAEKLEFLKTILLEIHSGIKPDNDANRAKRLILKAVISSIKI